MPDHLALAPASRVRNLEMLIRRLETEKRVAQQRVNQLVRIARTLAVLADERQLVEELLAGLDCFSPA